MIGSGILKPIARGRRTSPEAAFDTTVFSLSLDVPRPPDHRLDERLIVLLPMAKLVMEGAQDICLVRNISAGGLMAETSVSHPVGTKVQVEFNSHQQIPGQVVWTRATSCGIKFDPDADLRELLANRPSRGSGERPRPPRLDISCNAELLVEGVRYRAQVRDISLGGIKVAISDWNCVGKDAVATLEGLRPVKGTIRWYRDGFAGIVFKRALTFEELAEWLGARVEIASMKAGAWAKAERY